MKSSLKRLLAMLLACCMILGLAACGSSSSDTSSDEEETTTETTEEAEEAEEEEAEEAEEEAEEEEAEEESSADDSELGEDECWANLDYASADLSGLTIGYVTINSAAPWGGRIGTEFEAYAESVGATVNVLDANTDADLVTQYCQQMIDSGVDALVVFGGDITAMAEMAQIADEAGVAMFMAALDVAEEGREYVKAVVGPDQYQMCADIAAYVVEQNGTEEDYPVVQINGVPFLEDYIERTAGFQEYMADYPNYDLSIEPAEAYSSRTDAKTYMENFLTAYDVDIVMGYDDDLTMGAVQAIEEAGLTGEIKVYSLTGQADAIQAVIDGQLELTVMNRADSIAAGLVTAIDEYFSTGSTTYYHRTELTYITAENAEEYLDQAEF